MNDPRMIIGVGGTGVGWISTAMMWLDHLAQPVITGATVVVTVATAIYVIQGVLLRARQLRGGQSDATDTDEA